MANFSAIAKLLYYNGDIDALSRFVKQQRDSVQDDIDSPKAALWLKWAGISKLNIGQCQQAATLLEASLTQEFHVSNNSLSSMRIINQLIFAHKKMGNTVKIKTLLERSKSIQTTLLQQGLKTPIFVAETLAYYVLNDEQSKAERLLHNTTRKGWHLSRYIAHNPIFELLQNREQFVEQ
jgi:hypothetical protein